jgi:hypothetical protein
MEGSSSDSDSSSSASNNGEGPAVDFQALETEVESSPYDPAHHAQLIKSLRSAGPSYCEQLTSARERMAASMALTTELWLEWIEDESAVAASNEDIARVEALFERAAADTPSPEIYLAWAAYLEKNIDNDDFDATAIARVRSVHESALGSMGLHVTAGGKLWEAAVAFERRLLSNANPSAAAAAAEANSKITSLIKRQFSLPLEGMQAAALSLPAPLPPDVQPAYNIALNMLAARMRHETQLAAGGPDVWLAYAAWEGAQGEPSRAHLVHERR